MDTQGSRQMGRWCSPGGRGVVLPRGKGNDPPQGEGTLVLASRKGHGSSSGGRGCGHPLRLGRVSLQGAHGGECVHECVSVCPPFSRVLKTVDLLNPKRRLGHTLKPSFPLEVPL